TARTPASGAGYRGSNPWGAAKIPAQLVFGRGPPPSLRSGSGFRPGSDAAQSPQGRVPGGSQPLLAPQQGQPLQTALTTTPANGSFSMPAVGGTRGSAAPANRIYFSHCQAPAGAECIPWRRASQVFGAFSSRNMDDAELRPDGKPVPKKPGGSPVGTPFAGESSATGVPIPSPISAASEAAPPSSDDQATLVDADATMVDVDATIAPGTLPPRRTPPPTPSQSGMYGSAAVLHIGDLLGERYEILQLLGEGGMGAVYKATDRELDRFVALKVIRPELASNPSILARFKQELLLAHQVTHRNVIRIYDLGEAEGVKFITMEFIEGKDLRTLIREKKKFAPEEAVDIIQQVCQALDAAHSVGVIHRDLKPQNIMQDGAGRILVMDFGLARTLGGDGMTQTGAIVGTMEYMSPEQALAKELDQRSDLFALGLILYEMLTGQTPFHAESALASLIKRTQERAVPVSDIDAQIPG